MSFGLLAPFALGIGAMVALPLLAHLALQTPRERRAFGAMLLLERVVKRLQRRRRLKDPLLFALRVAAMVAVVLAVAGPRATYPGAEPEFGGSGRVVFVLDRSMSMQLQEGGSSLFQRAREQALEVVRGLPSGATVGLIVYDAEAVRLTPELSSDRGLIASKIESLQPSHGTSNLRDALLEARRLLEGEAGEVLLFTDEAGPRAVREATPEIERLVAGGSAIVPRVVAADPARNVAITSANYGEGLEGGQVAIRIANYGPDPVEVSCEVTLPDGAIIPIFADLPPQGETEERLTIPVEALGGVGEASCADPDLQADDARYFHLPRVGASRVLVVDGDPGDTPTRSEVYFLERALAPWGGGSHGITIDVTTPVGLQSLDADRHRVVFLANVSDPRPFGPRLTEFVRRGGTVVVSGGDNVTPERVNAALGTVLPAQLRRVSSVADPGEEGIPVVLPNTDHPLFTPFGRAGRGGFSRVRSHTLLTFEPYSDIPDEITTLLRYENGMPALVERSIGSGHVVVWTSTFDYGWSNLPLQAIFMPMMQRMVGWLGGDAGGSAARLEAFVGERVAFELPDAALDPVVVGPGEKPVASRIDGSKVMFTPNVAGAYRISVEDAPPLAWVAVNHDPGESDVRRYDSVSAVERDLRPELLERHVDLARPLFGLGLLLLFAQGVLALRGGV